MERKKRKKKEEKEREIEKKRRKNNRISIDIKEKTFIDIPYLKNLSVRIKIVISYAWNHEFFEV